MPHKRAGLGLWCLVGDRLSMLAPSDWSWECREASVVHSERPGSDRDPSPVDESWSGERGCLPEPRFPSSVHPEKF
ncbi:hypothetical protein CHELA1G11_14499 [Hyphomicrobiales bacterium]|nr:hypothetical protein CHELA1G11_14499 [Hyphomicrobiales bacterium]CAH1679875.1 hypothetical protein CHELA1G2_14611 [Hyphomicrobiales bacterium]